MKPPCVGKTEVFFPPEGGSYDRARKICSGCPIQAQCLADNIRERHGFVGGASPDERRAMLGYRVRSKQARALAARLRYHARKDVA